MKTKKLSRAAFLRAGRVHVEYFDRSGQQAVSAGGCSYPLTAAIGQIDDLPPLTHEERMFCAVRNHRNVSTVNNVCLECLRAKGKVVRQ